MTTTKAVELRNVTKTYGSVRAVDGLSLSIEPGEVVAFLGPNGAGKTTTIDMMLGLATPTTGSVSVFGGTPADAIAQGRISAVMQTGGLLRDLTVRETVELTSALFARTRSVKEVLTRAGIADIGDRRVAKCSGGQQQRLRFALALLPDPDLLVLDEPTTGMDVEGRRDFWNAIRQDASTGRTVLFATHYLDEADAYADRIVLVRHGKIVADGSAAEVKNLAAGRTVTATLPGVDQSVLLALPGVDRVDTRGDKVIVHGRDSDAVARYLLNDAHATDLEIVSRNLEDAFLALTTDSENNLAGSIR
ncbi:multidrug ABC transporter ATP-binding protein [Rhodococcus sp. 15-725-2-2b]|uniref:ABC transporter ATP-binding protein n=1 Tax=unclassified Rhodococcus (in: high G+C Gram-positive bacteria) TaxID=192944 RepID=UPI000B9A95FE|nr:MULTISPECIES: ABC transporter ATP-binding protein [unclassified Rhodococcus (in: high G+C Gram-positive bacteria)]OZC64788.1 multidrug ABC transporter ATP-binding protein [Rhodococcus sp. 06-469-3-2]OZC80280.1 multidrug ABC transporter ATP-binding protein [Rhodococcus sp. 06-418-5]OZD46711.1 multidrug ABC transporter ATP-binding protein [Rhodococcus sp. 06-1477-1A]OZE71284.1 multidrug ABC transporter ATP-binding protein [Rhodococcus sp. 15-725-2-2b]